MKTLAARAGWPNVRCGRDRVPAALAILLALSVCPVLLVEVPAMVDYPNHLARMSILARAGTPQAHPAYEVAWAAYPNLAMDLVVPPMARLIGVEAATRLFYVAGQLAVVGGAMALAFAVQRRAAAAGIAACLTLYSVPFAWGFVNFEFALGLALWAAAAWIALGPGRPMSRFAVHAAFVGLLVVSHLFALGIYGVTVGIYELWRARAERRGLGQFLLTMLGLAAPVVAIALAAGASGGAVGGSRTVWGLEHKIGWLFSINGFSREVSMGLTAILVAVGYGAARSGALRWTGAGPWLAAGFALLYLAMPFRLFDTAFVDVRVLVAAALILPAFVMVEAPENGWRMPAVAAVALANLAFVASVQVSYDAEYRALRASFTGLERGARILIGHGGEAPDPPANLADFPMYHAPTLAVHDADAFVPTLFTYPGKQPIVPRPQVLHLSVREGGPIPMALLKALATGRLPDPALAHVADWTRDFDYLYVIAPTAGNPLPGILAPISGTARFTAYRIRKTTP